MHRTPDTDQGLRSRTSNAKMLNNKHKVKICSVYAQFNKQFAKIKRKKVNHLQFHFYRQGFVKSAKLKLSFFESPENEEVFSELSFCLNVPYVSVNACPPVKNVTAAQVFEIAFHKKYNSSETLWLKFNTIHLIIGKSTPLWYQLSIFVGYLFSSFTTNTTNPASLRVLYE